MSLSTTFEIIIDPALMDRERVTFLIEKLADYAPVLEEIGVVLEEQMAENFLSQGYGGWAALKPSTLRDKAQKGYGGQLMLVRRGDLRAAVTQRGAPGHKFLVSGSQVIVGVYDDVIPYAYWLAHGTRRMAGRILAQMTAEAQQQIVEIITQWLGGGEGVRVLANPPIGD